MSLSMLIACLDASAKDVVVARPSTKRRFRKLLAHATGGRSSLLQPVGLV
jgi:hypothetical protein